MFNEKLIKHLKLRKVKIRRKTKRIMKMKLLKKRKQSMAKRRKKKMRPLIKIRAKIKRRLNSMSYQIRLVNKLRIKFQQLSMINY